MKLHLWLCLFLFISLPGIWSQENSGDELLEMDLDDLFNEEFSDEDTLFEEDTVQFEAEQEKADREGDNQLLQELLTQTGFTFTASYAIAAGWAPGWDDYPWESTDGYTNVIGVDLTSDYSLDIQATPNLRVYQSFSLDFPDYNLILDTYWAEYNLQNHAWFKMGQYIDSWTLSPNYAYANLLARLPDSGAGGDAYSFKGTLPVSVGSLQILALTRGGWVEGSNVENMTLEDLAYGGRYNLAIPNMDMNFQALYHADMPIRVSTSLKSTLFHRTELYVEGLMAWDYDSDDNTEPVFSGSIGFYEDFFNEKFKINGEYFYNGEVYISSYQDNEGTWIDDEESPYIKGHNLALNLYYNTGWHSMSLFSKLLWNVDEETAKWLPGMRFKPLDDLGVYLAFPMALGDRGGTYYTSNYDDDNRPFSVTLAVTLSGSYKIARY